jgi:hypothetical protein
MAIITRGSQDYSGPQCRLSMAGGLVKHAGMPPLGIDILVNNAGTVAVPPEVDRSPIAMQRALSSVALNSALPAVVQRSGTDQPLTIRFSLVFRTFIGSAYGH